MLFHQFSISKVLQTWPINDEKFLSFLFKKKCKSSENKNKWESWEETHIIIIFFFLPIQDCDGEDEFAPKEMTLQCTPASINVKVRNKLSGKEQAFWDDSVNSTFMKHFEIGRNNRKLVSFL